MLSFYVCFHVFRLRTMAATVAMTAAVGIVIESQSTHVLNQLDIDDLAGKLLMHGKKSQTISVDQSTRGIKVILAKGIWQLDVCMMNA